ncbi:MAG: hypothetical protein WBQ73_03855 [Candidatus Babeliales bacterium]
MSFVITSKINEFYIAKPRLLSRVSFTCFLQSTVFKQGKNHDSDKLHQKLLGLSKDSSKRQGLSHSQDTSDCQNWSNQKGCRSQGLGSVDDNQESKKLQEFKEGFTLWLNDLKLDQNVSLQLSTHLNEYLKQEGLWRYLDLSTVERTSFLDFLEIELQEDSLCEPAAATGTRKFFEDRVKYLQKNTQLEINACAQSQGDNSAQIKLSSEFGSGQGRQKPQKAKQSVGDWIEKNDEVKNLLLSAATVTKGFGAVVAKYGAEYMEMDDEGKQNFVNQVLDHLGAKLKKFEAMISSLRNNLESSLENYTLYIGSNQNAVGVGFNNSQYNGPENEVSDGGDIQNNYIKSNNEVDNGGGDIHGINDNQEGRELKDLKKYFDECFQEYCKSNQEWLIINGPTTVLASIARELGPSYLNLKKAKEQNDFLNFIENTLQKKGLWSNGMGQFFKERVQNSWSNLNDIQQSCASKNYDQKLYQDYNNNYNNNGNNYAEVYCDDDDEKKTEEVEEQLDAVVESVESWLTLPQNEGVALALQNVNTVEYGLTQLAEDYRAKYMEMNPSNQKKFIEQVFSSLGLSDSSFLKDFFHKKLMGDKNDHNNSPYCGGATQSNNGNNGNYNDNGVRDSIVGDDRAQVEPYYTACAILMRVVRECVELKQKAGSELGDAIFFALIEDPKFSVYLIDSECKKGFFNLLANGETCVRSLVTSGAGEEAIMTLINLLEGAGLFGNGATSLIRQNIKKFLEPNFVPDPN